MKFIDKRKTNMNIINGTLHVDFCPKYVPTNDYGMFGNERKIDLNTNETACITS